ncbi:MAG TPA: hypothetical protein VFA86_06445 [Gammaproteobacteria bacterium]|nr:hypothetical protein [Gammaproteobacteria bacterium]
MVGLALRLAKGLFTSRGGRIVLVLLVLGAGLAWHFYRVHSLQGRIRSQQADISQLRTQRDQYRAAADSLRKQLAENDAATRRLQKRLAATRASTAEQLRQIEQSPAADDAPVAPVLSHALADLRGAK